MRFLIIFITLLISGIYIFAEFIVDDIAKNIIENKATEAAQREVKIENLKRGCVIFWKGHVGIMIDKKNCIHANAYHMKTVTEPLVDIINRMGKNHQIIKMMDFN